MNDRHRGRCKAAGADGGGMKTEREKLNICIKFLEARGYKICKPLMTRAEVADLLGVSISTFARITSPTHPEAREDFPRSFNVGNLAYGSPRWRAEDVMGWIERNAGAKASGG